MQTRGLWLGLLVLAACGAPVGVGGAADYCDPLNLEGCVKFGTEGAFSDIYAYCTDPGTPAEDPLCAEPVDALGVTAAELSTVVVVVPECRTLLAEQEDAATQRSMREMLVDLSNCLSQDTNEGDSHAGIPPRDLDLNDPSNRDGDAFGEDDADDPKAGAGGNGAQALSASDSPGRQGLAP